MTSRPDLGDRVEAEAEEHAHGIHVPRLADGPVDPPEDAVEEAALVELPLELGLVVVARAHPPEDAEDADERGEVDQADEHEEDSRDRGPPHRRDLLELRAVVGKRPGERADAEGEQHDHREDDGRVAEAEPEADAHRPLALAHQLAGRVVDGGDVVGVEGVPHAEGVCRDAESHAEELAGDVVLLRRHDADEQPPADDVEQQHDDAHAEDAAPLVRGSACESSRRAFTARDPQIDRHGPTLDATQSQLQPATRSGWSDRASPACATAGRAACQGSEAPPHMTIV